MKEEKIKTRDSQIEESVQLELKSSDNSQKSENPLFESSISEESEKEISPKNNKTTLSKSKRNESVKTLGNNYPKSKRKSEKNYKYSITEPTKINERNLAIEKIQNKNELIEVKDLVLNRIENLESESESENIFIPRNKRCLIFIFLVLVNITVNLDEGNFPAATTEIQNDLQISPSQLGLFGSLQYGGNIIGCLVSMMIIDRFDRKFLFIIHVIMTGVGLFLFTVSNNIAYLYFDRIILGVFQAFIKVYCPVWVDQFGPRTQKTVMMALIQIGSPLGVVLGYIITMLIIRANLKWQIAFIVQSSLYAIFVVINIFLPKIYFSANLKCVNQPNVYLEEEKKKNKVESNKNHPDVISIFQYENSDENKLKSFFSNLCKLVRIKIFMICVFAISVLLFISIAIQFWTTNFLLEVMKIDETVVFVSFVVTCITAPTAGIILGGCIVQKIGGYESRRSLIVCCFFGLGAVLSGIPIIFFKNIIGFAIFLWLFLFFGGCIVPNLIGIILSSLPIELRGAGNSVTIFINNAIGFLPAPYLYGVIYQATKSHSPRFAYGCLIMLSIVALGLMIIGAVIREKEFKIKMAEEKAKLDVKDSINPANNNISDAKEMEIRPSNVSNTQILLKGKQKEEIIFYNDDKLDQADVIKKQISQKNDDEILEDNVSRKSEFINRIVDCSIEVKELNPRLQEAKNSNFNKLKEMNNKTRIIDLTSNFDNINSVEMDEIYKADETKLKNFQSNSVLIEENYFEISKRLSRNKSLNY